MVFWWKRESGKISRRSTINPVKTPFQLLDPEGLFQRYDKDSSGNISFDEFKDMLPDLGIKISDAKALKYFKVCDVDKSGFIDFEEFKVALYVCDPHSGNSIGFNPHSLLSPQDAFEIFDKDCDGKLDEDEFYHILEYLGLDVSDQMQEEMFKRYDKDKSGFIEYPEFKKIWARVSNTDKELLNRGILIPKFSTKYQRVRMLERAIDREDEFERLALEEAKKWRKWQKEMNATKCTITNAEKRALKELADALDMAGQIYIFGRGSSGQFVGNARTEMTIDGIYHQEGFDRMKQIWTERSTIVGCNSNTVGLWGRMPCNVAISDNVIFALTESGDIFAWGGTNSFWHEIEPDSYWQTHWVGDTTSRSKMLLTIEYVATPMMNNSNINTNANDEELLKLTKVIKYYDVWEIIPPKCDPLTFIHSNILPKVSFDEIQLSLQIRGKMNSGLTKLQMMDILHDDIEFEMKIYGELFQRKVREYEIEILSLKKRSKLKMAKTLLLEIYDAWLPLYLLQSEDKDKSTRVLKEKDVAERKRLDKLFDHWVSISSSAENPVEAVPVSGFTERGPILANYNGIGRVIFAGSNHVGMISKFGSLYTWGLGISGRLGLGGKEDFGSTNDTTKPTKVKDLDGYDVIDGSAGQSHTAVICSNGECFVWGSAHEGKLGLDHYDYNKQECFVSSPIRLHISKCHKIKRISCGANHTACIGDGGKLYVWGCGDGGRIGTDGITHFLPHLIDYLSHEIFVEVSCGYFQTLALTIIDESYDKGEPKVTGGQLYVAGAGCCLGNYFPYFNSYGEALDLPPILRVSAGYTHQLALTYCGDLLSWGKNQDGCCCRNIDDEFLPVPTKIPYWFDAPSNLAYGKSCSQSSIYGGHDARIAVDGNKNGHTFIHTQMDPQPFWNVDLEVDDCEISYIRLWNRIDVPKDNTIDKDKYTRRLFPCWIMISRYKFPTDLGNESLKKSILLSEASVRLTENRRLSTWEVPAKTVGRFVRLQLEGFNMLHFSEIEVFGYHPSQNHFGRIHTIQAGKHVSAIVIKSSDNHRDREIMLNHAIAADSYNRRILRSLQYYKDIAISNAGPEKGATDKCILCSKNNQCEICELKTSFMKELSTSDLQQLGLQDDLKAISSFLLDPMRLNSFPSEPYS